MDYIDSFSNVTQNSTTYGINLCLDNVYGTICANGFTNAIANLICKQNGYEGMIIISTHYFDNWRVLSYKDVIIILLKYVSLFVNRIDYFTDLNFLLLL